MAAGRSSAYRFLLPIQVTTLNLESIAVQYTKVSDNLSADISQLSGKFFSVEVLQYAAQRNSLSGRAALFSLNINANKIMELLYEIKGTHHSSDSSLIVLYSVCGQGNPGTGAPAPGPTSLSVLSQPERHQDFGATL